MHVVDWTNSEAVRVMHEVTVVGYQARAGRQQVKVEGHPGEVVLDAPAGVELRR